MSMLHSSNVETAIVSAETLRILVSTRTQPHWLKGNAMSDITYTPAARTGRFASAYRSVVERIAKYRLYRRTLSELDALDNRELADLGMNRSMLRSIAYKTAYNV